MYGWMLEHSYADGIPADQQAALADGRVTPTELEDAAAAEVACMAEIDGVESVDPYNWQNDIDLVGGGPHFAEGTDESALEPALDACYYEHLALVFTAWLDQEFFGGWTAENEIDQPAGAGDVQLQRTRANTVVLQ